MVKYLYKICSVLFYIIDINLLLWIKEQTNTVSIGSIGTKQQFSRVNSPESAVCHVTGADNWKHCVCLREPNSSTMSDYSSESMQVCS